MRKATQTTRRPIRAMLAMAGVAIGATAMSVSAQEVPKEPDNGMRERELRIHAITGARIVVSPEQTIDNATIVIRDGVITAIGENVTVPRGARVWDGQGKTIYPGFIDAAVLHDYEFTPDSTGAYWNERIHPELTVAQQPAPPQSLRSQLRGVGFTAGAFYPADGIFRGTGAVLSTDDDDAHVRTYADRTAMAAGFERGGFRGGYPGSLMGMIALARQALYDAQWYAQSQRIYLNDPAGHEPPAPEHALSALSSVIAGEQPILFEASDELNAMRAKRIADEFGLDLWLLGSGLEFRRLDDIASLNVPIIVPLDYPDRPDVTSLQEAEKATLRDMMTWEQAPTNARRLTNAGVTIAITSREVGRRFHDALRKAVQHGLSEGDALAAITTTPARMLGLDDVMGTLEKGKIANLVVLDGSLFEKKTKVQDVWVNGRRHEVAKPDTNIKLAIAGTLDTSTGISWPVELNTEKSRLSIELPAEPAADAAADEQPKPRKVAAKKVIVQRDQVSAVIDGEAFDAVGYVHLGGAITDDSVIGSGLMPDGTRFTFTITPTSNLVDAGNDDDADANAQDTPPGEPGAPQNDPRGAAGVWQATADAGGMEMPMTFEFAQNDGGAVSGTLAIMDTEFPLDGGTFNPATGELAFSVPGDEGGSIAATISGNNISGTATSQMGTLNFQGRRAGGGQNTPASRGGGDRDNGDDDFEMPPDALPVPFGAYGLMEQPESQSVLVHSATIWTSGPEGIIEDGWMLVRDGKIQQMGTGGYPKIGVDVVIDAKGKHVSPGLIDCHSHTGISGGVNEGGQVNTAEVRIDDVIDPDDINWYRQLAGGLTAANQLHGSANPMGGQNSAIKIVWGGDAEDFRIPDDHVGIKFALGENVKRSGSRYPNTRMGVETVIRDAFTAAQEYEAQWEAYNALASDVRNRTMPPRRDLEMDALVEILNGDRLIHCHSYRQDEILMLMRLAESFGFRIGTFQHILEGYKVAETMAEHGAMGSSFSDWWAYKVEVMDAIPYNGALMHELGVVVSFNSDSSELARRMNDEAAKAVRYGGVEPSEALKFVTLNPAKQLGIEHRTGSLEVGKDADFVIWSASPLSSYSRCEQTWVNGTQMFSDERHAELAAWSEGERQRLIQKILASAHGEPDSAKSAEDQPQEKPAQRTRVRDRIMADMAERARMWMAEQVRLGEDPEEVLPGMCGCNDYWLIILNSEVRK